MRHVLRLTVFLLMVTWFGEALGDGLYPAGYATLLSDHVRSGVVDYAGIKGREAFVEDVLDSMAAVDPAVLSAQDRMAFYVNAYNLWTIKLILEHWPGIRSIKEAGSLIRSPWKRKFVRLAGGTVSLDDIEHGILRREYHDARLHFALNCASLSCPPLAGVPYQGRTLDAQLDAQTASFINDPAQTFAADGRLHVSKIFDWYGEDFGGETGVWTFIRRYAGPQLAAAMDAMADHRIVYSDYDWSLNDRPPARRPSTPDAAPVRP